MTADPFKKALLRVLQYAMAIGLMVYSGFPIYYMMVSSVRPPQEFLKTNALIPTKISWDFYRTLTSRTDFVQQFMNSFIVAFGTVAITIVVSIVIAYIVARYKVRGKTIIVGLMLYAYMFPPLFLAIPLVSIFAQLGLTDTLVSVIVAHVTISLPLGVWFLWGFFKAMPFELEEAAMVDGCTRAAAFLRVVLPLSLPGIITVGTFSFLLSWSDYTFAVVLLSSDSVKTIPLGLASLLGTYDFRWGEVMAGATLVALPLFLLFTLFSRYFIAGMAAGALKG
ncbi:MAG TPA: carbohydrate ABC transporter permease [Dongiaceae bacterium]|jgi:multiple sugar transport system permease protein|nr:carbohydrate ABC transporter permease [Dongiaceae bacterium]